MNYKSKQHLTEALTTITLSILYVVFATGERAPNVSDLESWARTILVFIGAIVVINIAVQIIFHVFFSAAVAVEASKKHEEHLTERIIASSLRHDERDKQINHHAGYIASFIISFGFILSVIFLAFGGKPLISLHISLAGLIFASLVHSIINVIAYERGVANG